MSFFELPIANTKSCFCGPEVEHTPLIGAEVEASRGFAERRLAEFAAGRHCARKALQGMGLAETEIPVGEGRQPMWPEGVSGSISHTEGMTGAVLAMKEHHPSLGLDIERRRSVDASLWKHLFKPEERSALLRYGSESDEWATLYFSLKETFYKLQYPLTGRFLDFLDVALVATDDGYRAEWDEGIVLPSILKRHRMGYLLTDEHVLTYGFLGPEADSLEGRLER